MLEFKVKTGEGDKVFGSISVKQIKDELNKKGFKVEKSAIKLDTTISSLGFHNVDLELYNDVIETTMLNVLYAGNFKTMLPKLKADNFEGIELIRPLYYIEEEAIKRFIKYTGLWPLNCACMVAAEKIGNKRHEIKALIAELKKNFNDVDKSIFKSAANVNMNSILGWEKDGEKYSFLDPNTPKSK